MTTQTYLTSQVYLTSDHHFRHKNILKYCRPELLQHPENVTREEMIASEKMMIERWNSVVGPEDVVYHVGDFTLRRGTNVCRAILGKLHGTVVLIKGNHDRKPEVMLAAGFAEVRSRLFLNVEDEEDVFWHTPEPTDFTILELHHFPAGVTNKFPAVVGHSHNTWSTKRAGAEVLQWDHQQDSHSITLQHPMINVSVENWNYTPLTLQSVRDTLDNMSGPEQS